MDQVTIVEDSLWKSWGDMVCLSGPYFFKFFKGCLQLFLLGPFLNTLSHLFKAIITAGIEFKLLSDLNRYCPAEADPSRKVHLNQLQHKIFAVKVFLYTWQYLTNTEQRQCNVWNLFRGNNKDTRTTSMTLLWCFYW